MPYKPMEEDETTSSTMIWVWNPMGSPDHESGVKVGSDMDYGIKRHARRRDSSESLPSAGVIPVILVGQPGHAKDETRFADSCRWSK
jgi:hypothetical protein